MSDSSDAAVGGVAALPVCLSNLDKRFVYKLLESEARLCQHAEFAGAVMTVA